MSVTSTCVEVVLLYPMFRRVLIGNEDISLTKGVTITRDGKKDDWTIELKRSSSFLLTLRTTDKGLNYHQTV